MAIARVCGWEQELQTPLVPVPPGRSAVQGPQLWHNDGDSQQMTSGHGTLRPGTAVTAGQKDAGGGSSAAARSQQRQGRGFLPSE